MQAVFEKSLPWLAAQWALSDRFIAGTTVGLNFARASGQSGLSPADDARKVLAVSLSQDLRLLWLKQVHSAVAVNAGDYRQAAEADAAISCYRGDVPVVLTADCVPIVIASADASIWSAVHAGWQGLYRGIIAATVAQMQLSAPAAAWIGPCIRQSCYEVDSAFHRRFADKDARFAAYFLPSRPGHYQADLPGIARLQLADCGVARIADCGICSYCDERFFSYRRSAGQAGRMATFITPRR